MHRVGNAPGSRSPAMPLQFVERCACAHMRPPLTHRRRSGCYRPLYLQRYKAEDELRVHLGGGLIPTRLCHAFKAGAPLRVSVAADVTLSEPAKDEDNPLGFVKKVLDIVFRGVVWMVIASFLILICGLGITHSHAVFKFCSETATGNILVVASGFLTVFGKFLSDKLDTYQAETRKEQAETRKEQAGLSGKLDTYQAETRKELALITQALNSVAVQLASIQTSMAWMRGDYGGGQLDCYRVESLGNQS